MIDYTTAIAEAGHSQLGVVSVGDWLLITGYAQKTGSKILSWITSAAQVSSVMFSGTNRETIVAGGHTIKLTSVSAQSARSKITAVHKINNAITVDFGHHDRQTPWTPKSRPFAWAVGTDSPSLQRLSQCGAIAKGDILVAGVDARIVDGKIARYYAVAKAKDVFNKGTEFEEIILNPKTNSHFSTAGVISGKSWIKSVDVIKSPGTIMKWSDSPVIGNDLLCSSAW